MMDEKVLLAALVFLLGLNKFQIEEARAILHKKQLNPFHKKRALNILSALESEDSFSL